MPLQVAACDPWPVQLCCEVPDGQDPAVVERWTKVASTILWRLSGRRWGPSCPITVRPCRQSCLDSAPVSFQAGIGTGPWVPYIGTDGAWRNASVCGCATNSCGCGQLCEVRLEGPVHDIVEVLVDGEALVPEAYRVDSANLLVRTDGECWPACQDLAAPCDAPGTWCVTYRWGLPLDETAIAAVSELTCHLMKGCNPGKCGCRANQNVTRLTRQGVEMEMTDPSVIYSQGRTGLPVTDLWLATVNPYRLSSPSRVYSPDLRRPRSTTWP